MRTRPLGLDDFEPVSALLAELEGGRPPLPTDSASRARVRVVYESHVARVAEGSALSRVAEDAGAVVGFVSAEVRPRLNQQTPEVWISDLVVAAAHRGRGVGKALLGAVVADARRIGAHGVCLESGRWRKDAHRFYAREGMADVGSHFVLKLR